MTCKYFCGAIHKCMNVNRMLLSMDGMITLRACYPGTDKFKKCNQCEYYIYKEK